MQNRISQKIFVKIALLFVFLFFFVIEWRWQAMLLGAPDIKPHIATAGVSAVVIIIGLLSLDRKGVDFWLILLSMLYLISVAILNARELAKMDGYSLAREFGALSISFALFMTACNKHFWQYIYGNPKKVFTLCVLFALSLFYLLYYSGAGAQSHFNLRSAVGLSGLKSISEHGVSYQSFGDKMAVLAFIMLSLNIPRKLKIMACLVFMAALYVVGGRASMVGYLFACCAYYIIYLWANKRYMKCAAIIFPFLVVLSVAVVYVIGNSTFQNSDNWLLSSIAQGRSLSSISSRHMIEEENQRTRGSRFILGDYKFDYKLGRPGSYTHSALGIVDYYGLPIFLFSVGLWFYLFFRLTLLVKHNIPIVKAAIMSMLFYTLLFSIARFPPNYLTFWVLGMAVLAASIHPCGSVAEKALQTSQSVAKTGGDLI